MKLDDVEIFFFFTMVLLYAHLWVYDSDLFSPLGYVFTCSIRKALNRLIRSMYRFKHMKYCSFDLINVSL
jgi:hypothetical protein